MGACLLRVDIMAKVNVSGKIVDEDEAKISVFDHGLLYGDGVFEGIRIYDRRIFRLDEHMARMYDSARSIDLEIPIGMAQFKEEIIRTCRENGIKSGYIRALVTRGIGDLGLDPYKCKGQQYVIIAMEVDPLLGTKSIEGGVDIMTSSMRRTANSAMHVRAKTLNYLNSVMALSQALRMGKSEAIMLNEQGFVAEGSGDNLFAIKGGVLRTPPPTAGALEGITRATVMEVARAGGITVEEKNLMLYDLYTADEIFLTGTLAEIVPVKSVDGRQVGDGTPGKGTRKIAQLFRQHVAGSGTEY